MGIASFLTSSRRSPVLAPLQALLALLLPAPSAAMTPLRPLGEFPVVGSRPAMLRHATAETQRPCHAAVKAGAIRRLKVVREYETGINPACAGRMVISGRMADVCAELDRMALRQSSPPAS